MTRRSRRIAPLALAVSTVVLAGCGGGSSTTTTPFTLTPATAVLGQANFTTATSNQGGAAGATTMAQPLGGAVGNATAFFVPDTSNNRILGYTSAPTVTNTPANFFLGQPDATTATLGLPPTQGNLAKPAGVAIGVGAAAGALYFAVADTSNNRVLIWNSVPTANTPPDVVVGQPDFVSGAAGNPIATDTDPVAAAKLASPNAVAIAAGKLIVADKGNNRVLIWKAIPTANGTPADVVIGQTTFQGRSPGISSGSNPVQVLMSGPAGLWSDGASLLVADTVNDRVLYYASFPSVNGANPDYVIGQSSFTFHTAAASAATMSGPTGVSSDGSRIFVADTGNNRVLIFSQFPLTNGAAAYAVLGQESFTRATANDDNGNANDPQDGQSEAGPTQKTLSAPTGAWYQGGKLYVTDRGNNRVMIYDGTIFPVPGNN